ncbi:MAG TPA: MoaD/ThiS family protein [Nitrososphaeraceae archaeon]|nr:MoaD/ThiS family protein [Nitrososphaeraceae archaeon]
MKLFASVKEIAGGGNSEITLQFTEGEKITFTVLRKRILQTYPRLTQIPFVFAINYKIVADESTTNSANTTITSSDEVALLPPISGG